MYMSSMQRGMIPDLENLSVNELNVSVRWVADNNEVIALSTYNVRPTMFPRYSKNVT